MTSFLKVRVLTSFLTSRVSCPSPWVRRNFPSPLNIEQTPLVRMNLPTALKKNKCYLLGKK